MDWSTVSATEWQYLAVLWLAVAVGKGLAIETRVLMGLLVLAVLVPLNFGVVALAWLVGAIVIKLIYQFTHWV